MVLSRKHAWRGVGQSCAPCTRGQKPDEEGYYAPCSDGHQRCEDGEREACGKIASELLAGTNVLSMQRCSACSTYRQHTAHIWRVPTGRSCCGVGIGTERKEVRSFKKGLISRGKSIEVTRCTRRAGKADSIPHRFTQTSLFYVSSMPAALATPVCPAVLWVASCSAQHAQTCCSVRWCMQCMTAHATGPSSPNHHWPACHAVELTEYSKELRYFCQACPYVYKIDKKVQRRLCIWPATE